MMYLLRRFSLGLGWMLWASLLSAQAPAGYQMPPAAIADLVNAPNTPLLRLDPQYEWLALLDVADLPSVSDLAAPELRLAGLRINPRTNGPSRISYLTGLELRRLDGKGTARRAGGLPPQPRLSYPTFSPDGRYLAFAHTTDSTVELWVAEVANARARRLTAQPLNAAYSGTPFAWLPDSQGLIAQLVPANRGAPPLAATTPTGPVVQENIGRTAPSRTYQDLLKNADDEALFDYYATAQVARVGLDGQVSPVGPAGVVQSADPSPDGRYVLVKTLHRPYSYLVPSGRFPTRVEVFAAADGQRVATIADLPLAESIPIGFGAVADGPRDHDWRADAPATLHWAEAQDGGDPKREVDIRDRVYTLAAPFAGEPQALLATQLRYAGIVWGNDNLALASEYWWPTRQIITRRLNPATGEAKVLIERSFEDSYGDPGSPQTVRNAAGQSVLQVVDNRYLFFFGDGASSEGDRPFVDRWDLRTGKKERLWRSEAPYYEQPLVLLDPQRPRLLTRRESREVNPNYYLRDLKRNRLVALTDFPHPYPQLKGVKKEKLRYERADGVALSADLYLPADYTPDQGPLPTFLWAYPEEFKSKDNAGQISGSPYAFTRLFWGSPLYWVTRGYAVLDNTSIPIVGEDDTQPNDTFVEQLVASARAAIAEGARRGVVDSTRVGVGGHSYGAFMTANLLAHSDLFRAGIARSGAYNRTFTPFGFQREERTYWQAPEVYNRMSPFMHADQVKTPLLLIHGEADNNAGTFPIQSERFYNALKGHGATTRLVLLPHESHGYRGKESVLHMLWEMDQWLETYVKQAKNP